MAYERPSAGSHAICFPTKILAAVGGAHIFNITLTTAADNGNIIGRGAYQHLDNYAEAAVTSGFAGKLVDQAKNGNWYVEVTALPSDGSEALLVYNSPIIPYESPRELADLTNFYNAAGEVVKAYTLTIGDIFEVSAAAFTSTRTPVKGRAVSVSSKKLEVAAS